MQSADRAPVEPGRTIRINQAHVDLSAFEARRAELKSQLQSLTERRVLLTVQMRDAAGPARSQLEARIRALDDRTGRIDSELNAIDDQINQALAQAGGTPGTIGAIEVIPAVPTVPPFPTEGFRGFGFPGERGLSDTMVQILIGQGIVFVLFSLVLWRALRRRVGGVAQLSPEDAGRLDQLQRSVDVMAVEVERIAEGQRYVAKMMHDQPGIPAGAQRRDSA